MLSFVGNQTDAMTKGFVCCFQVDIYAGSVFLYEAVGWNVYISAACILAITAVYTLLGKCCKQLLLYSLWIDIIELVWGPYWEMLVKSFFLFLQVYRLSCRRGP